MAVSVGAPLGGSSLTPDVARPAAADATPTPRRRWTAALAALYPLLLAVFPALDVAAGKAGTYSVRDLVLIVAVLAGVAAAAMLAGAAVARLLGRGEPLARGALLAALGVVWVLYYMPLAEALAGVWRPLGRATVLGGALLLGSAALAWLALRRRWVLGALGKFVTLAGVLLVGNATAHVVVENARSARRIDESPIWKLVNAPVPVRPALARPGPKRDIYLFVLDGYPNASVLRQKFAYDNGAFVDSLRALGFTIPQHNRSNYTHTILSLSSMLNFEHDTLLARSLAPESQDHTFPTRLIQQNRAARFLRSQGYRYVLFPTFWFEPTRRSPIADRTFADARVRSPVRAALLRGELRRTIFRSTLLSKFRAFRHNYDAEYMLDEFRSLPEVPADSAPTFTFAHFMLPHQPIVLDDRCRPINGEGRIAGMMENPGPTKLFLGAVHCANTQVLGVVGELLRRSAVPPIIILVGDHGTISRRPGEKTRAPQDSIVTERLGAFGAFYMPDGGAALFADSSTHVNILRRVFRYYFGADLPDLGNDGFFTAPGSQYRFVPVDERIVIGG